jgi:hypothetical protein
MKEKIYTYSSLERFRIMNSTDYTWSKVDKGNTTLFLWAGAAKYEPIQASLKHLLKNHGSDML